MKKILLASAITSLLAGSALADGLSFGVDTDVVSTDAGTDATVTVRADGTYALNGAVGVAGVEYDVEAEDTTEWYIGAVVGSTAVTYGEQSDLFDFGGGLNTVAGNVLADPASAERNLNIDGVYGLGVTVGLDTDTDIQNVQVVGEIASVSVGVDYNVDSEEFILGAATAYAVSDVATVGGIVTYVNETEDFAAELNGSYAVLGGDFGGFVTANEDGLDVAGLGYERGEGAATLYVEGARDLNTDENTVAAGISFSF